VSIAKGLFCTTLQDLRMFQRVASVNLKSQFAWVEVISIQRQDSGEVLISQTSFMLAKIMSPACKNFLYHL
jgi:hypothetical protein